MDKAINFPKNIIIFGIPVLIIGLLVFISQTTWFHINPSSMSIGITIDLLITVPIVYFLLIRKTKIPKTTIVPVLFVGIIICSIIIPSENQQYLSLFKFWILPLIELIVFSYIFYNIRKAVKRYKKLQQSTFDFFSTLRATCKEILPKNVVMFVVTEIAVIYYGFIYWRKRPLKENEYSYHKNSGSITLLVAIIFIVAIETVTLHFLLLKWSVIAAWVLTFLSVYSGIQLFGFLKSMIKRPHLIENGKLYLRYGIMSETTINIVNIDTVELSSKDIELNKETRKLSILGELESHNIIIRLKKKNTLIGLYGVSRNYKNLVLFIDDKVAFKKQIDYLIQKNY